MMVNSGSVQNAFTAGFLKTQGKDAAPGPQAQMMLGLTEHSRYKSHLDTFFS